MPLGISAITELGRFTKAYRRLDQRDQVAVDEVIGELLSGEDLPSGRWLKRVQSSSGVLGSQSQQGHEDDIRGKGWHLRPPQCR